MTSIDIVSIGEPLIEFNQTQSGEPSYLQGFGGDTSNMIIAAARQGAVTAYVTRLGDDEFGRMFLALWQEEGVDVRAVDIDPQAHTGVYFVTHGAQGHVFSYLRAGSAASRMRPHDLPLELIRSARSVHATGISLAISPSAADAVLAAFEAARGAGVRVSFDSNLRLKLWPLARARALIAAAAALSDYFFPSLEDARALSGHEDIEANLDWAHGLGARIVFLKLGPEGVLVSDGSRRERVPGFKVKSVDATGAGDCFCGAAVARLTAGDSIWDAARYANAAAALATTGFGAVAPLPRPEAVRRLLATA
ncbi:MAG TPA: sugar kinase [Burkholderiaceae bacterium]|nr:sugar kinase [Burkholderiaceae bacterium]